MPVRQGSISKIYVLSEDIIIDAINRDDDVRKTHKLIEGSWHISHAGIAGDGSLIVTVNNGPIGMWEAE